MVWGVRISSILEAAVRRLSGTLSAILVLAACLGLPGCAGYVKRWTPVVQASVGHNVREFIDKWGPPVSVYEQTPGPNKVYVWNNAYYYRMLVVRPDGIVVDGRAGKR
jgi:hypothetical protein